MPHLIGVEAHLTTQSSQWRQRLHQPDALVKPRMHRAEHQECVEGLRATFSTPYSPSPCPLHNLPASAQLAALGAAPSVTLTLTLTASAPPHPRYLGLLLAVVRHLRPPPCGQLWPANRRRPARGSCSARTPASRRSSRCAAFRTAPLRADWPATHRSRVGGAGMLHGKYKILGLILRGNKGKI